MDFVIIFGPPAVGKMAVGMELEKLTGLKLFHNHMSIEFVQPFFNYGTETGKLLVYEFRKRIFEEFAKSSQKGMIFTYFWDLSDPEDKNYIDEVVSIFTSYGARVFFVELYANIETRLVRNSHPLRLLHKKSKNDLDWSNNDLINADNFCKTNSDNDFFYKESYYRIDNTNIDPINVAVAIKNHFLLG